MSHARWPRFASPLLNIAALNFSEFKTKMARLIIEHETRFNPQFKDAKFIDPALTSEKMRAEVYRAAQYEELLTDANIFSILSARAYHREMGLLHRSMARAAIVAAVMAAEDYANLAWLDQGKSRNQIRGTEIRPKWNHLLPRVKEDHPFFDTLVDIRNNTLTHF